MGGLPGAGVKELELPPIVTGGQSGTVGAKDQTEDRLTPGGNTVDGKKRGGFKHLNKALGGGHRQVLVLWIYRNGPQGALGAGPAANKLVLRGDHRSGIGL